MWIISYSSRFLKFYEICRLIAQFRMLKRIKNPGNHNMAWHVRSSQKLYWTVTRLPTTLHDKNRSSNQTKQEEVTLTKSYVTPDIIITGINSFFTQGNNILLWIHLNCNSYVWGINEQRMDLKFPPAVGITIWILQMTILGAKVDENCIKWNAMLALDILNVTNLTFCAQLPYVHR